LVAISLVLLSLVPVAAGGGPKSKAKIEVAGPELLLDARGADQRKLSYERSFSSERDVRTKRSFWTRLVVTDPGARGIHIFDFGQQKYKFISRGKENDGLHSPQCVAVDAADNIYVTDSEAGKIFVFEANGKFLRVIGSLKGGEGFFKRPTGIAVDSQARRIFVTDTLRNKIFVLDMQGIVLQTIGKAGAGNGEFNLPTELRLQGPDLIVVDAMNFRLQVLDRSGGFRYAIGRIGDGRGEFFRPKGVGVDSEGHLYVAEGLSMAVQVFDTEGSLLYYFGGKGTGPGEFQFPAGLWIDRNDRIFVVDSFNRRVQVFHYFGVAQRMEGVKQ
jgi:DNA-binding beta-propeller fold protein YncE